MSVRPFHFTAIAAAAGASEAVTVANIYSIWLLEGQSNVVGRGAIDGAIDTGDARVFQFDSNPSSGTYRTIIAGIDPLKHPDGTVGVGPGMMFAKRMADILGKKILLVPSGVGGARLTGVSAPWGAGGSLRLSAIDQSNRAVTAAIAQYPGSTFDGILSIQGEGDGDYSISTTEYARAKWGLIGALRAGITGATNVPYVMGRMLPEAVLAFSGVSGKQYDWIDDAHTLIGSTVPKATVIGVGLGYSLDGLHYNGPGERLMGPAMADAVATAIANPGEAAPAQVTGLAVSAFDSSSVTIGWSAASGARDYEVQYKASSSGIWIDVNAGVYSLTLSETVGGLAASTSYDFRVRAANFGATPGAYSSAVTQVTAASSLIDAPVTLASLTGGKIALAAGTYTISPSATFTADHAGVSDIKMPSGVAGSLRVTGPTGTLNGTQLAMLGLVTTQTDPAYSAGASGYKFGILAHNSNTYRVVIDGGASAAIGNGTSTTVLPGDILQLARASDGTIVAQVARAASPTTFTTVHTFVAKTTADLWAAMSFNNGTTAYTVSGLIGNGWA